MAPPDIDNSSLDKEARTARFNELAQGMHSTVEDRIAPEAFAEVRNLQIVIDRNRFAEIQSFMSLALIDRLRDASNLTEALDNERKVSKRNDKREEWLSQVVGNEALTELNKHPDRERVVPIVVTLLQSVQLAVLPPSKDVLNPPEEAYSRFNEIMFGKIAGVIYDEKPKLGRVPSSTIRARKEDIVASLEFVSSL